MSSWIAQHFLNPSLFWPAAGLLAVPVVIHLINRLRYKRVRFAAMEFLLTSQQQNRRRILIEHLLLLLARVMIVGFIGLLIARFVADPNQLSLFQGMKSHHIILLDDSGSMQDRTGETTAFQSALEVIRKLTAEGAQRPETQKLTLLRMSRPREALSGFSERNVDEALLAEMASRFSDLKCTWGSIDLADSLEAVKSLTDADAASIRHLHIISDFRRSDWFDNKSVTSGLQALSQSDVTLNLVRTVPSRNANLSITSLEGEASTAAAGVPVLLNATVHNYGAVAAEQVRLLVQVDGQNIPGNYLLERIEAGESASRSIPVLFETAGTHRVAVTLESDSLEADNERRVTIMVAQENPVLVIAGSPLQDDGQYIRDALAADRSVTGYNVTVETPEFLRRHPLDQYQSIYLVNVPELPEDAVDVLEKYVTAGGGLAWFLGDLVRPGFYSDRLYKDGAGLFPIQLEAAPQQLQRDETSAQPDIVAMDNPLFRILSGADNPFIDQVFVNIYYPVKAESLETGLARPDGLSVLASLRNRAPLMIESRLGRGRIITCLTAAGPIQSAENLAWTNWANGPGAPSYAVMNLELVKRIARQDQSSIPHQVGEPIRVTIDRSRYRDDVEVISPDEQITQVTAVDAAAVAPGTTPTPMTPVPPTEPVTPLSQPVATFTATDEPGFYTVTRYTQSQQPDQQMLAYNVPLSESDLVIAEDQELLTGLGESANITIQPAGSFEWIRSESPGKELRWLLLLGLAILLTLEQLLSWRLSYHPTPEPGLSPRSSRPRSTSRPSRPTSLNV